MISPIRQRRVALLLTVGLGALLTALAGYLVAIHVKSAEALASRASRMHHMRYPIPATRGRILDARLRVLAGACWPSTPAAASSGFSAACRRPPPRPSANSTSAASPW